MMMMTCNCRDGTGHRPLWTPATNEDGWRCAGCGGALGGDPPGFRPDLDRAEIGAKVYAVSMIAHDADLLYFSNSDCGEDAIQHVSARCRELGLYDQYTILRLLCEYLDSHATYWRSIAEGVLAGKDSRRRCWCGKLARLFTVGEDAVFCGFEHKAVQKPRLFDCEGPATEALDHAI